MTLPLRVLGTVADVAATLRQWKPILDTFLAFEAFDRPIIIPFVASQNGQFTIDHKLGRAPRGVLPLLGDNDANLWQFKPADGTHLYLSTDAALTCRLWVW